MHNEEFWRGDVNISKKFSYLFSSSIVSALFFDAIIQAHDCVPCLVCFAKCYSFGCSGNSDFKRLFYN